MKISWMDKIRNEEVFAQVNETREWLENLREAGGGYKC